VAFAPPTQFIQIIFIRSRQSITTKENFTTEEWQLLILAPTYAATYIITADMSIMGAVREMKAMMNTVVHPNPPAAAQELVNSVSADIQAKTKNKEEIKAPEIEKGQEGADGREPARQGLRQAAALVDERCAPEEAAGLKQWLLDIAQTVAEADKEGSHFGRGGVMVTDKEKAALAEIASFIGL
jgi:hypothetical protein